MKNCAINISEIIANPDYIGINPNEQGSSDDGYTAHPK